LRISVNIIRIFLFFTITLSLFNVIVAQCQDEYVYYGAVPDRIWQVTPVDANDLSKGWNELNLTGQSFSTLVFLAYENGTNINVYKLGNDTATFNINLKRMDKALIHLVNGTIFKVISNYQIYILFLSSPRSLNETEATLPTSFYLSIDGHYVGTDFMLVPTDWVSYDGYRVIALEPAEVTITDENDTKKNLKLGANQYAIPYFRAFTAYSVKSTGKIMIQSGWVGESSFYLASVYGGFVGTDFYSVSSTNWDPKEENWFKIMAFEDTKAKVLDINNRRIIAEFEVTGGSSATVRPSASMVKFETDRPVTVAHIHEGTLQKSTGIAYGKGVSFIGIKPDVMNSFYLPTESHAEAYIFSNMDANVLIDGSPLPIKADSYILWTIPGIHNIVSDKNIVLQILQWPLVPSNQGALSWGVTIPCIQMVDLTNDVTLIPVEEKFPTSYIITLVMATVIAIAYIMIKRQARK